KGLPVALRIRVTTYRSPNRMTKISTWVLSSSVYNTRSPYCNLRRLLFLGTYNKMTSMTG
ncbi:hypothetical protein V1508DRAFT_330008, partial [Lipomyces doorenjongii]|uniref:uncharacterized protein n=1 Tax=Lipomyces doorenjongii TaxID=383834 RepID=UPI0034CF2128